MLQYIFNTAACKGLHQLIIAFLLFYSPLAHAQQTRVTDSGIVVPAMPVARTTGPTQYYTTTYDKILAHPRVVFEGGQRVVAFDVSFLPKKKDYCGPFQAAGNIFPDKAVTALKKYKGEQVEITRMFIENIVVKERDSLRNLGRSYIITVTP